MKNWIAPLVLSIAILPGAAPAQATDMDSVLLACTANPDTCAESVQDFIETLDVNAEDARVTIGLLAKRLYDMGLELPASARKKIQNALLSLSDTLEEGGSPDAGQVDALAGLIDELGQEQPGNGNAEEEDDTPVEASDQ